jgi:hypothetical protein
VEMDHPHRGSQLRMAAASSWDGEDARALRHAGFTPIKPPRPMTDFDLKVVVGKPV